MMNIDNMQSKLEELKENHDDDLTRVGYGMGCKVDFKELDLDDLDLDEFEKLDQGWRWHGLPK